MPRLRSKNAYTMLLVVYSELVSSYQVRRTDMVRLWQKLGPQEPDVPTTHPPDGGGGHQLCFYPSPPGQCSAVWLRSTPGVRLASPSVRFELLLGTATHMDKRPEPPSDV